MLTTDTDGKFLIVNKEKVVKEVKQVVPGIRQSYAEEPEPARVPLPDFLPAKEKAVNLTATQDSMKSILNT